MTAPIASGRTRARRWPRTSPASPTRCRRRSCMTTWWSSTGWT